MCNAGDTCACNAYTWTRQQDVLVTRTLDPVLGNKRRSQEGRAAGGPSHEMTHESDTRSPVGLQPGRRGTHPNLLVSCVEIQSVDSALRPRLLKSSGSCFALPDAADSSAAGGTDGVVSFTSGSARGAMTRRACLR